MEHLRKHQTPAGLRSLLRLAKLAQLHRTPRPTLRQLGRVHLRHYLPRNKAQASLKACYSLRRPHTSRLRRQQNTQQLQLLQWTTPGIRPRQQITLRLKLHTSLSPPAQTRLGRAVMPCSVPQPAPGRLLRPRQCIPLAYMGHHHTAIPSKCHIHVGDLWVTKRGSGMEVIATSRLLWLRVW